jgi:hypothetical protein
MRWWREKETDMKNGESPGGFLHGSGRGIPTAGFDCQLDYWAVTERVSVEEETAGAIPPVL